MSKIEDNHSIEGKNISQAGKSEITNLEQDQKKIEGKKKLVEILQNHNIEIESLGQRMHALEAQLNALPGSFETIITDKLNGFLGLIQQQQAPGQPQPDLSQMGAGNLFNQLSPTDKANAIGGLLDGLSKIVGAWKGNSAPQQDSMGELGKQLVQDLIRATVDDIRQKVYQVRLKPPPDMISSSTPGQHSLQ